MNIKRGLVLLFGAMMAVVLSVGLSAPASATDYYSYHGCSKYSQGYESSGGKCHHKDMKKDEKKNKQDEKKNKQDKQGNQGGQQGNQGNQGMKNKQDMKKH